MLTTLYWGSRSWFNESRTTQDREREAVVKLGDGVEGWGGKGYCCVLLIFPERYWIVGEEVPDC